MKILLVAINAKYIHSNLGVYSLKAYAKRWQEHVRIMEYTINQRTEQVLRAIYEQAPDVVAFSCYIWNLDFIERLLPDMAKILPGVPIFIGGPEVSYETEAFLKAHPQVTGVLQGEGERTFDMLCEALVEENRTQLEQIPGLLLGEKKPDSARGREAETKMLRVGSDCLDMDMLPFPYENLDDLKNRIIYYESSRGCPFSCSYCLSSIDKRVRFRSLPLVYKELDFFLEKKVPQVKFVDRTFNCNRERALAIWQYIRDHDNGITNFHFEVSADLLGEEELDLLKSLRPGQIQLEIGVQTTNRDALKEIRRKTDLKKLEENVKRIHDFQNIHIHLDLIAGLPFENLESFRNSFNQVYAMEPDQLQLGFLKVLKGSYMYEKAEEYGLLYGEKPTYEILGNKWISYDDILLLKGIEEMVEIYYNSGQFAKSIKKLVACFPDSFSFYRVLSEFYREQGYGLAASSRIAKYEVLLQFAKQYAADRIAEITELLVFDLYSREKVKVRPDWAPSQEAWKEEIHEFYRKEAVNREYLQDYEGYSWKQLMNMCHIEIFSYPRRRALLFDYRHRSPLNHGARIKEVIF